MHIGSFTSVATSAPFAVVAAGQAPNPHAQKQQVNAQADLLQAVRAVNLPGVAAAKLSDGGGIDIYV